MKTMCPPGYHHNGNGFVETYALGHMCMNCPKAIVVITGRAQVFMIAYIYIYIYIYIRNKRNKECNKSVFVFFANKMFIS